MSCPLHSPLAQVCVRTLRAEGAPCGPTGLCPLAVEVLHTHLGWGESDRVLDATRVQLRTGNCF